MNENTLDSFKNQVEYIKETVIKEAGYEQIIRLS